MDELLNPLARHAEQVRDLEDANNLGHDLILAKCCTLTNAPRGRTLNTPLVKVQQPRMYQGSRNQH